MSASNEPLPPKDAPEGTPLAGTPYRVVSLLGSGGMGEVYLADHVELGKRFVVKLLHQKMVSDPRLVDRTRIEAQALARLKHPSIVQVTDFGRTCAGRPYLVMEWLRGVTLADEIRRRGSLPLTEAVAITRGLLGALGVAHAIGIVHRDVKPGNLFLHQPPGQPRTLKVLDFGIAKIVEGAPDHAPRPLLHPTEEGVIIGTPRFISPEAIAGHAIDHRADLYSVALVLYTMLCGRGPWDRARGAGRLLAAQLRDHPPPPSELAGQRIGPELDAVVLKALSKAREDRYQSAAEFDAALASVPLEVPSESGAFETAVFGGAPAPTPSSRPAVPSSGNVTLGGAIAADDLEAALQTTVPLEPSAQPVASASERAPACVDEDASSGVTRRDAPPAEATIETAPPSAVTGDTTAAQQPSGSGARALATEPISDVASAPASPDAQATRTAVPLPVAAVQSAGAVNAPAPAPVEPAVRPGRGQRSLVRLGVAALGFGLGAWWLLGWLLR